MNLGIVLAGALFAAIGLAGELTPEEQRGKTIYLDGTSPGGGQISAFVGQDGIEIPAAAIPCASCHGPDGRGRPEGGVLPTDINWAYLTKSYGHVHAHGRTHGAFAEDTVARAITLGIDPDGNTLDPAMPRYPMPEADLSALITYLKRLATDLDPGLANDNITLGTVISSSPSLRSLGQAIGAVLTAYFDDLNARGGIYNRKLALRVAEADIPAAFLRKGRELIQDVEVFALVGAVTAGVDAEFAELVEGYRTPLVGPFTQFPLEDGGLHRYTFYLLPGLAVQGRALVEFAARKFSDRSPRIAVVHQADENTTRAAEAVVMQAGVHGWPSALRIDYPPGRMDAEEIATALKVSGIDALFFLAPGKDFHDLAAAAEQLDWAPLVFLAGSMAGRRILETPRNFQDKVFLAYPSAPSGYSPVALREFNRFHRRHGLARRHLPAQIAAYSSAQLLMEGLKRAGRELSREKLVTALEGLYEFKPGLIPPLSYGPNRRIGALGAYIVAVDLERQGFEPVGDWIALR